MYVCECPEFQNWGPQKLGTLEASDFMIDGPLEASDVLIDIIHYPLSSTHYPLPIIHYPLSTTQNWGWVPVQVFRRLTEINVLKMARPRAKLNQYGLRVAPF